MDIRENSQLVGRSQWGGEEWRWSRGLQIEKDDTIEHQVQPSTKNELDALWTGICWHGLGTYYLCYKTNAYVSREDRLLVICQRNGEGSN
jgi:hypothetical protein